MLFSDYSAKRRKIQKYKNGGGVLAIEKKILRRWKTQKTITN
jgi:hypothetical protein